MSDRVRPEFTLSQAAICLWAAAVVGLGALLVLKHEVPLPETSLTREGVARATALTRAPDETGKWLAVHVLYEGCGCSARVLEALLHHPADERLVERIVFVRHEPEQEPDGMLEFEGRARARGYRVESRSRDDAVARYGVESAPSLVIVAPDGALRYLGGYSARRAPVFEDRDIERRVLAGETVTPFPTFGCAVGRQLALRTNPLNL